jgi:hypothetical protein
MPSTSVVPTITAQSPAKSPPKDPKTLAVTGKNRAAIDFMVWEGLKRADAAAKAGLKDHALYVALTKPHVKQYYAQQCEVLRTSGRARRIHRLEAMLEQDDNKAAVINAALALDRMPDQALGGSAATVPGLQIVIVQGPALIAHDRGLPSNPLISNERVHDDE